MEDKKLNSLIKIENRKECYIDGVSKLDSFDDKEFLVDTVLGFLHIKGKNLTLGTMDMENGQLLIKGEIDSLSYLGKTSNKEGGFFKKIFK